VICLFVRPLGVWALLGVALLLGLALLLYIAASFTAGSSWEDIEQTLPGAQWRAVRRREKRREAEATSAASARSPGSASKSRTSPVGNRGSESLLDRFRASVRSAVVLQSVSTAPSGQ
jgi:hypothetical protein